MRIEEIYSDLIDSTRTHFSELDKLGWKSVYNQFHEIGALRSELRKPFSTYCEQWLINPAFDPDRFRTELEDLASEILDAVQVSSISNVEVADTLEAMFQEVFEKHLGPAPDMSERDPSTSRILERAIRAAGERGRSA